VVSVFFPFRDGAPLAKNHCVQKIAAIEHLDGRKKFQAGKVGNIIETLGDNFSGFPMASVAPKYSFDCAGDQKMHSISK
jgi:hypothetical protein